MRANKKPRIDPELKTLDSDAAKKDLLSPEKLAWACQTNTRRRRHYELVKSLGLPVPTCLLPTRSTDGGKIDKKELRIRKDAIRKAVEYGEQLYGAESNRVNKRKRDYLQNELRKQAILKDREEVTKAIEAAPAKDEDVESLDGERVGDKPSTDDAYEIDYEILPSFLEYSQDLGPTCWALIGPAGGGKSVAVVMKMLQHAATHKEAKYVVLRNTYRQLHDTTMPTFFKWVPRHLGKWDSQQEKFTLAGKWEFYFRSCERPEDVDKFKGMEITGYFMNEAMEMKPDVKKLLDQRVGRFPTEEYIDVDGKKRERGTSRVFRSLDSNPPDQEHWLYKMFVEKPLEGHRYVLQPPFENEHNLPEGYYDRMRESYRDSPDLIDRYILGKWGAVYRGKAVYKDYDSRVHLAKKPLAYVPGLRVYGGMDFGLTPSAVWTQIMSNGSWHIISELCCDNVAADEFSDAIIAYSRQFFPGADIEWYGDPSGGKRSETDAKSVFDIFAEKGIYITPGQITVSARLESVRKRLRMRGGLVLSPSCVRLATGFSGSYCYKEIATTGYYSDKPEKNKWSHIHDALQYVASSIFEYNSGKEEAFLRQLMEHAKPVYSKIGY